ncbi:MAG: helix-turn-helix domain-containing protein [Bacteroidales bacterium]|nr:helix-turn-helix domain-containing protein [Bacteroidales bacterium]
MTNKFFKIIVFLCYFILTLCINVTIANEQSPLDSLQKTLPTLKGEDRLNALTDILALIAMGDDLHAELTAIEHLRSEAAQQGNVDIESQAREKQVFCLYNYNMYDELEMVLPDHLKFLAKHKQWDNYYNCWEAKIELLIYADKTQTAIRETELMYEDAKLRNNNYGLGVSAHTLGILYQTQQRYDLAIKSFNEAIERLTKEENISLLLSTYNVLCETLDANYQYAQMLAMAEKWEATIDNYKLEREKLGYTPMLNGRYMYCYLALVVAHFNSGNTVQAEYYMDIAEELAEGRSMISQFKLLHVQTRLFEHLGQYDKAIACADTNYQRMLSFGDSISSLTVLENKARILRKAGKGMEAALMYETVMMAKDSLRNLNMAAQLDELRTIYEVDKLILENQISKSRLIILFIISIFLILLVVGYIFYTVRLNRKNKILFEKIRRTQQAETQAEKAIEHAPEKSLSKEQLLFRKLNSLLDKTHSFTDPKLGRKDLSDLLGTNSTYLANAIKECSDGMSVNEYINRIRLVYAGNLLLEASQLTIDAVGEDAGFNSRSTYYRLFRDYYGMSPSEFRKISKQSVRKITI